MFPGRCMRLFSAVRNVYNISHKSPTLFNGILQKVKPVILPALRYQHLHQTVVPDKDEEEIAETKKVIGKVNDEIHNRSHGRLFAVVGLAGRQFKITEGDIVVVSGTWPPTAGDKIRLEKVLLVGCANFTLVGRPILAKDQVSVYATVIEKTMSQTDLWFVKRPRKRFKKTKLTRSYQTYLRITSIDILAGVDEIGDVDGVRDRIF